MDRAQRTGESLVLAFLDVDRLKQLNDSHGHEAGEQLLREVGMALQQGLRSYDVVVRYGGDEFVCALPGSPLADAEQRFIDVNASLARTSGGGSVSVGLAEMRDWESLEQAIGRADRDMYHGRRIRG